MYWLHANRNNGDSSEDTNILPGVWVSSLSLLAYHVVHVAVKNIFKTLSLQTSQLAQTQNKSVGW